jgi:hypothetical protein
LKGAKVVAKIALLPSDEIIV